MSIVFIPKKFMCVSRDMKKCVCGHVHAVCLLLGEDMPLILSEC